MRAPFLALSLALTLALVPFALAVPDKEADEAIKAFKKAFATKDDKAREAAVVALAPVQHKWVAEALQPALTKDTANAVRIAAAKALGGQWSLKATEILVKSTTSEDEIPQEVGSAILRALGETGSDAAVPTLLDALSTSPHAFRNNKTPANEATNLSGVAIAALHRCGSSKAIGPLIDFLSDEVTAKRGAKDAQVSSADGTLVALTGQKIRGAKAWKEWWAANSDSMKTVKVYRCEVTGTIFDKPSSDVHCPACGDKNPRCGTFLRTRAADAALNPEEPKKGK